MVLHGGSAVTLTLTARRFVSSTTGTSVGLYIVIYQYFHSCNEFVLLFTCICAGFIFFFICLSNVSVFRNYHV